MSRSSRHASIRAGCRKRTASARIVMLIGTHVIECGEGRVLLEVSSVRSKGERLKVEKGVNFPGTALRINPLTDKDLVDLDAVAELAGLVGFSFVQRPAEILQLHGELAR